MGLLVYKIKDYDNKEERVQFKYLCSALQRYYSTRKEICIFIANYNVGSCELDGLLFKEDAIIAIEFKNYGGTVTASNNGQWTLQDGTIIKGGARNKTPFDQARINRSSLSRALELLWGKKVKDVASLIVFHKRITLINNLDEQSKMWLDVTDDKHFLDKVEIITSPRIDLSEKMPRELVRDLNLLDEYLCEEYSNKELLHETPSHEVTYIEPIHEVETQQDVDVNNKMELEEIQDQTTPMETIKENNHVVDESHKQEIIDFFKMGLDVILNGCDYTLSCLDSISEYTAQEGGFTPSSEYIIVVHSNNISDYKRQLDSFFHSKSTLLDDRLFFDYGKPINKIEIKKPSKPKTSSKPLTPVNKKTLPKWLDSLIYGDFFGANYSPDYKRYAYNRDLTEEELLTYLGTYFPRSYSESYCIFSNLFANESYIQAIKKRDSIRILDVGCGSGGEILGLLELLEEHLPNDVPIDIYTFDGNPLAQQILMELISQFQNTVSGSRAIQIYTNVKHIDSGDDVKQIAQMVKSLQFDFILCDKICNELITVHNIQNAYYELCASFAPLLNEFGVIQILDVTTKDDISDQFYPILMNWQINDFLRNNENYISLLPVSCAQHPECENKCFTERKFYVSHSKKEKDLSKVAFRIIARKDLLNVALSQTVETKEVVNESCGSNEEGFCPLV